MRRLLAFVVACIALAHAPGEAQRVGPPYSTFAGETGDMLCFNWNASDSAIPFTTASYALVAMRTPGFTGLFPARPTRPRSACRASTP